MLGFAGCHKCRGESLAPGFLADLQQELPGCGAVGPTTLKGWGQEGRLILIPVMFLCSE